MKRVAAILLTLSATATAFPAAAQYGVFDMGILTNTLSVDAVTLEEERRAGIDREAEDPATSTADWGEFVNALTAPPSAAAAQASLPFRPEAAVTARVQRQLVDAVRKTSAEGAADMQRVFASGAAREAYAAGVKPLGMDPNDAMDALALYLASAWGVANADPRDFTPAMLRSVRAQVGRTYARLGSMLDTNAKRQEVGESLMYQTVILENLATAMKSMPPAQRRQIADQMHAALQRNLAYNLRSLELTDAGFRKRG